MTVDIDKLPAATVADLERVGQCLYYGDDELIVKDQVMVASRRYGTGDPWEPIDPTNYRVLTEAQAIAIAKTMADVHEPWRAAWPKENAAPAFEDVRPGDTFDYNGRLRTVDRVNGDGELFTVEYGAWGKRNAWDRHVENGYVKNYRRANATNIGELVLQKMRETDPYINVINDIPATEEFVEAAMASRNAEFCERQEAQKEAIKRAWFQTHRPNANGLCVMKRSV